MSKTDRRTAVPVTPRSLVAGGDGRERGRESLSVDKTKNPLWNLTEKVRYVYDGMLAVRERDANSLEDELPPNGDRLRRSKGDRGKLKIAGRLRAETLVTVKWIAERLEIGTASYMNNRLYRWRKGTLA